MVFRLRQPRLVLSWALFRGQNPPSTPSPPHARRVRATPQTVLLSPSFVRDAFRGILRARVLSAEGLRFGAPRRQDGKAPCGNENGPQGKGAQLKCGSTFGACEFLELFALDEDEDRKDNANVTQVWDSKAREQDDGNDKGKPTGNQTISWSMVLSISNDFYHLISVKSKDFKDARWYKMSNQRIGHIARVLKSHKECCQFSRAARHK